MCIKAFEGFNPCTAYLCSCIIYVLVLIVMHTEIYECSHKHLRLLLEDQCIASSCSSDNQHAVTILKKELIFIRPLSRPWMSTSSRNRPSEICFGIEMIVCYQVKREWVSRCQPLPYLRSCYLASLATSSLRQAAFCQPSGTWV